MISFDNNGLFNKGVFNSATSLTWFDERLLEKVYQRKLDFLLYGK